MDYEQKYKEALKWIQGLYSGLHGATKEEAERYFPELKENEDERIRKAILIGLIDCRDAPDMGWTNFGGVSIDKCIDWLEKQGKKKETFFDFKAKDWYVSKVDGKIYNAKFIEKQDEQKSIDSKKIDVLKFIRKETCCGIAEANEALLKLIKVLKEHPSHIMDKPRKLKIEWEEQK